MLFKEAKQLPPVAHQTTVFGIPTLQINRGMYPFKHLWAPTTEFLYNPRLWIMEDEDSYWTTHPDYSGSLKHVLSWIGHTGPYEQVQEDVIKRVEDFGGEMIVCYHLPEILTHPCEEIEDVWGFDYALIRFTDNIIPDTPFGNT